MPVKIVSEVSNVGEEEKEEAELRGRGRRRSKKPQQLLTCQECGYSTDRKNNLSRHVSTMHGQIKDGSKECCGEVFHTKAEHKNHCANAHKDGFRFGQ